MNRRLPIMLIIIAAMAVAVVALSRPGAPDEFVRDTVQPEVPLLQFSEDAVTDLSIAYDDGERVLLRRDESLGDGSDGWRLVEPFSAPADGGVIMNALRDLSVFRAFRSIGLDDETVDVSKSTFGLDPPRATLAIKFATQPTDAERVTKVIFVGETTQIVVGEHETYYVQLPGEDAVYAAGGAALSLINMPLEFLVEDDFELPSGELLDHDF